MSEPFWTSPLSSYWRLATNFIASALARGGDLEAAGVGGHVADLAVAVGLGRCRGHEHETGEDGSSGAEDRAKLHGSTFRGGAFTLPNVTGLSWLRAWEQSGGGNG